MTVWSQFSRLMDYYMVYFTLQLVRCGIFSFLLIGLVMLLRKTLLAKWIFAKGTVWSLFLIIPFLGKMKLFYEHGFVKKATWQVTAGIMKYPWISHMYTAGILMMFLYIFVKRVRLHRIIIQMKRQSVHGRTVYITDMNVAPFAAGLLKPKIVLPKVAAENLSWNEIEAIIRHEQSHIRLLHLWCYFIWDILRCLIWLNPFLTICQKYFRSDMEDICDRVCIQNSGIPAREYGLLLLKTIKILKAEHQSQSSQAAYWGADNFNDIKGRMEKIINFCPYEKNLCRGMLFLSMVCLCIICIGINSISYARCREIEDILVYEYNPENGSTFILNNSDRLQQIISYDDNYVYIDRAAFESLLSGNSKDKEVFIVFGGYQKLPGMGTGGNSCFYQAGSDEEKVRIAYEKAEENWITVLFKIL